MPVVHSENVIRVFINATDEISIEQINLTETRREFMRIVSVPVSDVNSLIKALRSCVAEHEANCGG